MADGINDPLKAELQAALAAMEPQIRGLDDLEKVSISPELKAAFEAERQELLHRKELIQTVLQYLEAAQQSLASLEADGYPAFPAPPPLSPQLTLELAGQNNDIGAAVAIFSPTPASTVAVKLGAPTAK